MESVYSEISTYRSSQPLSTGMQVPENPFQCSAFNLTNHIHANNGDMNGNANQLKRRCLDDTLEVMESKRQSPSKGSMHRGKHFLLIKAGPDVFHSENYQPRGETLFVPLLDDVMINMLNIEQISISSGGFFLANANGTYYSTQQGDAIHLWRYDTDKRKLYISRSILFIEPTLFAQVKQMLQCL